MTDADTAATGRRDDDQLVTFHLGQEEFGFDIMSVQEIIRQPVLSRVPMAPDYVEGIANLRGTVLPIIDTRTRFGMPRADDSDNTRVLVVDVDGVKTGLRVDQVRQVARIDRQNVAPPPDVVRQGMNAEFLQGVVKLDHGRRIIMSLDPAAICRVEGLAPEPVGTSHAGTAVQISPQRSVATADDRALLQVVSFQLGEEEFAFPMECVREILRLQRVSEVPNTPSYLLGILTVRGNILPVIDLRLLLGLRTLAAEVLQDATRIRKGYESWLSGFTAQARPRGSHPGLAGPQAVKDWLARFTTSSQALMEILSAMRTANDKVLRTALATFEGNDSQLLENYGTEARENTEQVLSLLRVFEERVASHILEDQRLVVVQTRASLLALVVDKVREVLNVPKRLVDAAPRVGGTKGGTELDSVVRLDDGKRLIMLLSAERLLGDAGRDVVGRAMTSQGDKHLRGAKDAMQDAVAEPSKSGDEQQFVTFRLADGEYGIPIHSIQEIDRSSKMTRIPNSAECVDGITNLRGEVVPVINARKRFHLPSREADEQTRVIILDVEGKKTGLLVDSVRQVLNIATRDIAPPPASIGTDIEQRYLAGIGKVDGGKRMIVLLNVAHVVAPGS